jgi:hypothetical protein
MTFQTHAATPVQTPSAEDEAVQAALATKAPSTSNFLSSMIAASKRRAHAGDQA